MKFFLTFCLLLFTPFCSAKHHYAFLPSAGIHYPNGDYENKRILFVSGHWFCKGDNQVALPQEDCDYWVNITLHKGKVSRQEAGVIALQAVPAAFDIVTTVSKMRDGCTEWGARHLIGEHPSRNLLIAENALFVLPTVVKAVRTPLYNDSASKLLPWATYRGEGSFRAARKNLRVVCTR